MHEEQGKPKTQASGAMPPPRPPTRTATGLSPAGDDDDSIRKYRKNEQVRISLPPKPSAQPTIRLPLLPVGTPTMVAKKGTADPKEACGLGPNEFISITLVVILQAVLLFEAFTSIDGTTEILFLIVATSLSIPGYQWARNRKSFRTPLKLRALFKI